MSEENWFIQSLRRHIIYPSRLLTNFEFVRNKPGEHRFAWEGAFMCRKCGKMALKTEEQLVKGMFVVTKITCYECSNIYEITEDEMGHISNKDEGCKHCQDKEQQ